MEELAAEYNGKLKVVKVNVDDNSDIPRQYQVRNIPYLLLFKDGNVAYQIIGAMPKSYIKSIIDKHLRNDLSSLHNYP